MWRVGPLLKLFLRMFCLSAALFAVSGLLFEATFRFDWYSAGGWLSLAFVNAAWSVVPALVLALPLPAVTILFFREIRRPAFYRFSMLMVALIATLIVWEDSYIQIGNWLSVGGHPALYAAAVIARNGLAIFISVFAANSYIRDVSARNREMSAVAN